MRKHYPLNSQGAEDAGKLPWTDGVPSTGVEGSYPGQALFTDTEAEILAAIDASGQTRNSNDLTQLIQAIATGIYLGQYAGTANALTAALPNNVLFASLRRGTKLTGFVTSTNTAGVTVAITCIGSITAPTAVSAPLLRRNGTALQSGDLPVNQDFEIRWDGSAFRMVGAVASDGGGSGSGSAVSPTRILYLMASQTLTIQAGETRARVLGFAGGGGGGGSYSNPSGGSGGGGGGSFDAYITGLTTGQAIPCTVAAGGAAGGPSGSAYAGSGGTTSFGSYASATGGTGGQASSGIGGGAIGTGGSATLANGVTGQTYVGGNGGASYPIPYNGGTAPMSGYGGGCQMGGQASTWGSATIATNASAGNFPGGGANAGIDQGSGGPGGAGLLIVALYP